MKELIKDVVSILKEEDRVYASLTSAICCIITGLVTWVSIDSTFRIINTMVANGDGTVIETIGLIVLSAVSFMFLIGFCVSVLISLANLALAVAESKK